ncbi:MAG: hypothetical protein ACXWF8_04870 [Methylobacter sp.]
MQSTDQNAMPGFKERLKTAEQLLKIARASNLHCRDVYDFLGVARNATPDRIKAAVRAKQNAGAGDALAKSFSAMRPVIEALLSEDRIEYDNYLTALAVKELRKYFIAHASVDSGLDDKEKDHIIQKGIGAGLPETQVVKMIERWTKEHAVNSADKPDAAQTPNKTEPPTEHDAPLLKVICMKDDYYVYKNVARGDMLNETIVIKNDRTGLLKGRIVPDVEWLVPERYHFAERGEQTLKIHIDTGKIPTEAYQASGAISIETNGGSPYRIPFRVVLKDLKLAVGKFRRTYLPVATVYAGFIGSFSHLPVLGFLAYAVLAGTICFFMAQFVVKTAAKVGLNLFKIPGNLIKGSAAFAIAVILFRTIGGLIDISEDIEQQISVAAAPTTEALAITQAPPEAKVAVDVAPKTVTLAGSIASVDDKIVGIGDFWRFGFDAQGDKAHYSFACSNYDELHFRIDGNEVGRPAGMAAIRERPNRVALHFRALDWDFVEKCSKESRCGGSACPLEIAVESGVHDQNVQLADADKKRKRAVAASAKKKQWISKTGSFAPPSREEL